METKTNGNDLAFAKAAFYHPDGGFDTPQSGLTKREYIATQIAIGLSVQAIAGRHNHLSEMEIMVPKSSVAIADSLIKELNKDKNSDVSEMENTDREPQIGDMVFAWNEDNMLDIVHDIYTAYGTGMKRVYKVGGKVYKHCSLKNPLIK